jgi:hypothetical protein
VASTVTVIYILKPELNNANRFLRGGDGSDTAEYTYQEDALQQHVHEYYDRYKDASLFPMSTDGK